MGTQGLSVLSLGVWVATKRIHGSEYPMKTSKLGIYSQVWPCIINPKAKFRHQTAWGSTGSTSSEVPTSAPTRFTCFSSFLTGADRCSLDERVWAKRSAWGESGSHSLNVSLAPRPRWYIPPHQQLRHLRKFRWSLPIGVPLRPEPFSQHNRLTVLWLPRDQITVPLENSLSKMTSEPYIGRGWYICRAEVKLKSSKLQERAALGPLEREIGAGDQLSPVLHHNFIA